MQRVGNIVETLPELSCGNNACNSTGTPSKSRTVFSYSTR